MLIDTTATGDPDTDTRGASDRTRMSPRLRALLIVVGLLQVGLALVRLNTWYGQGDVVYTPPAIESRTRVTSTTLPPGCPYAGAALVACETGPARSAR